MYSQDQIVNLYAFMFYPLWVCAWFITKILGTIYKTVEGNMYCNSFCSFPFQVWRRFPKFFPLQSKSIICLWADWRHRCVLFWHARAGVRLRLSTAQLQASLHLLPGQCAFLPAKSFPYGSIPRDSHRLPWVCQNVRVSISSPMQ